ncbi:MAG: hypothetical protein COA74_01415 [Gammaproteobacteria bacterium]|nr:MAG: hypothetical protein COA74_01415 [Gammaproteobacteria bacterium]
MNKLTKLVFIVTPLLAFSFASNAHEPKLHKKNVEKANCAPLEKMKKEGKKMDMTDPVMIAMMKKCKKQTKNSEHHDGKNAEKMNHKEMNHEKKAKKKQGDEDKHDH